MNKPLDTCQVHCIHEDAVNQVLKEMISIETAQALAELFKTLSDPSRVKLIFALLKQELCVCDLASITGSSESSVSHHLRVLRAQKLVKFRRQGKVVYYSLDDHHVEALLSQGLEHVSE